MGAIGAMRTTLEDGLCCCYQCGPPPKLTRYLQLWDDYGGSFRLRVVRGCCGDSDDGECAHNRQKDRTALCIDNSRQINLTVMSKCIHYVPMGWTIFQVDDTQDFGKGIKIYLEEEHELHEPGPCYKLT